MIEYVYNILNGVQRLLTSLLAYINNYTSFITRRPWLVAIIICPLVAGWLLVIIKRLKRS